MTLEELEERDPLTIDPGIGTFEPVTRRAPAPRPLRDCCGRPDDEHPKPDPTTRGTCRGPHTGTEISMHWNGRGYVCTPCALDAYHAALPVGLEQRLVEAFGEEAAELDRRAIEASGIDPVEVFERSERAA